MQVENMIPKDYYFYSGITSNGLEWQSDSRRFYFINSDDKRVLANDRIEALKTFKKLKNDREELIKDKIVKLLPDIARAYFNSLDITDHTIFNVDNIEDKNLLEKCIREYLTNYNRCDTISDETKDSILLEDIPSLVEDIFIYIVRKNITELNGIDHIELINKYLIPIQKEVKNSLLDYIQIWIG